MTMMKYILVVFIINQFLDNIHTHLSKRENILLNDQLSQLFLDKLYQCSDKNMCKSKWGFCGYGEEYCGEDCQSGPCTEGQKNDNTNIINQTNFQCAFNNLDNETRTERLDGLKQSGWTPQNADEAAVFLAHVYHETDGLKTLIEYCAPGCGPNYAQSWCDIQGVVNKLYYGRGWFQLSYPCNYNAAGIYIGLDLLNNPDLVSQQQDVAVKSAIWFYQTNNMDIPARQGDFAATTRIINGPEECNGGAGTINQMTRIATYQRIRQCFQLGETKLNPKC